MSDVSGAASPPSASPTLASLFGGPDGLHEAERALLEDCRRGRPCRLGAPLPPKAWPTRDAARLVRADFLRFLALGGAPDAPVHERGIQLEGAWIEGALELFGTTTKRPLELKRCRFESIDARWSTLLTTDFSGCLIETGFKGDGLRCPGGLFLRMGTLVRGGVNLPAAVIGGLYCEGGVFCNRGGVALNCEEATITSRLGLHSWMDAGRTWPFRAIGRVSLANATIGSLQCGGGRFTAPRDYALNCAGAKISGDVNLNQARVRGQLTLLGADIRGDLDCRGAAFDARGRFSLVCESTHVAGIFLFADVVRATGAINLWNMRVGTMVDDKKSWACAAGRLILDGFTYGTLINPTEQSGEGDPFIAPDQRIIWLKWQDEWRKQFRPQPWDQLAATLRRMGHLNHARDVAVAKEWALREAGVARNWRKRPIRTLFHLVYGVCAGFGYKTDRLFWILCGTWAVFASGFALAAYPCRAGPCLASPLFAARPAADIGAARTPAAPARRMDPILYSLDALLPIDLGYASTWSIRDSWGGVAVRWAAALETILGWVFAGLGLGALGNLVKRD